MVKWRFCFIKTQIRPTFKSFCSCKFTRLVTQTWGWGVYVARADKDRGQITGWINKRNRKRWTYHFKKATRLTWIREAHNRHKWKIWTRSSLYCQLKLARRRRTSSKTRIDFDWCRITVKSPKPLFFSVSPSYTCQSRGWIKEENWTSNTRKC